MKTQIIYFIYIILIMSERKKNIVLNHYQIKEKIGHGAFGEIYLAINQEDHSEVALKIENAMSKRSQLLY